VGAADDDGGDRGQQISVAHPLIGLRRIAGEQHSGQPGAQAAQREGCDQHGSCRDAGEIGRRLPVADRVDVTAEHGAAE
jgi:hypothetical protein